MIRLGVRLAIGGGRESAVRLVLTAVGVAIGTTLLLLAAAADPAIRTQQRHTAWQYTGGDQADLEGTGDPLLWHLSDDAVDGQTMTVLRVAATGPGSPVPLGLDHVPRVGEVYVSPALGELLRELPADRLADRYPSAPAGLIGDDYLAGPDELVVVVGMPADALRPMDALEVHHIRTRPAQYQFTDVLRIVFGIGAVGLLMPVVVFVATSTRIGAARREQRFAALRLAGATPRQTNVIAAVEAGATAAVGAVLGWLGFTLLRPSVADIEIDGHGSFVADVRVPAGLLVVILLAIPALAVVTAMMSLRRLQISPLGVARRAVRSRPTFRRLLPLLVGTVGFVVALSAAVGRAGAAMLVPLMAAFALMIYGIVAAGPWLTVLTARAISRTGRSASVLLAGRRLEDDPAAGFRAVSGLVVAVFVASVFSGVTPAVLIESRADRDGLVGDTTMVVGLSPGTTIAEARAALDEAASAGAGRDVVLHVDPDPDQTVVAENRVPGRESPFGRSNTKLVACADLEVLGITGRGCPTGGAARVDTTTDALDMRPTPYTATEIADMPPQLLLVETDGTMPTADRVRTALERALPGVSPWLGSEAHERSNRRLVQLNRVANLALAVTLTIAGCALAVAVAAGIIERKRPFALLRLAGMHLAELRRTALLEAAAPLVLISLVTAAAGLGTSAVIIFE